MKRVSLMYAAKECLYLIMYLVLIVVMSGIFEQNVQAQSNVAQNVTIQEGDEWRYFKGLQAPPRKWKESGFDDSNWLRGPSGFGYGQGMNRTYLGDMQGNYLTIYARREFTVGFQGVTSMILSVSCDGPFVAYIDGIEIIRSNTVRRSASNQLPEQLDVTGFAHELTPGINVLSVECSNDDINSSDFSFVPSFEYTEKQEGF